MKVSRRIRIVIVDDSAVMRSLLRSVLTSDPTIEVVGTAGDGATALDCIQTQHPDLVLLDVEMPVKDGLATLRELRRRGQRMPVIMCSSLTQRGARVTIEALAYGASDYVAKPSSPSRQEAQRALAQDLLPKIHALATTVEKPSLLPPAPAPSLSPSAVQPLPATAPVVLAIGVSTGGPAALDVVLPALPANYPLPVLIVQHMPAVFTRLFAERLNSRCHLHVVEASEGVPVAPGTIYIAPGDWHMEALAPARPGARPTIHLNQNAQENHCRPAVDVLFRSAAKTYGGGVLAVILTGMGADGLASCRIIHSQGGTILAQDEATSTVWGMPGAVAQAGLAHRILPLAAIAPEILRITSRATATAPGKRPCDPVRMVV
jgi:two-component system, chemotaxis family, protein-glutamate methylesterase/glutaminase